MIRRLFKEDKARLFDYIGSDREINVSILSPLSRFGYDHPLCEVHAVFDDLDGAMTGVICRYFNGYTVYSKTPGRCAEEAGTFLGMSYFGYIQGTERTMRGILPYIGKARLNKCEIAALHDTQRLDHNGFDIRPATGVELSKVYELLANTEDFSMPSKAEYFRAVKDRALARCGRVYALWQGPLLIATASTQMEGEGLALVASVATRREFRRKGFASAIVSKLCGDIMAAGLVPVIVYYCPSARSLYRSLGFEPIGDWFFAEMNG